MKRLIEITLFGLISWLIYQNLPEEVRTVVIVIVGLLASVLLAVGYSR